MKADGGGAVQLTKNGAAEGSDWALDWSPDGGRLVLFHSSPSWSSGAEIQIINADGSGRRTVLSLPGGWNDLFGSGHPTWSPDGRQIAYALGGHIHVMNADGSNPRKITSGPGIYSAPAWGSSTVGPVPLRLTLGGRRVQRLDRRNRLRVGVTTNRALQFDLVEFSVVVSRGSKRFASKRGQERVTVGVTKRLGVKFRPRSAQKIRRALRRGKRLRAKVTIQTRSPVGVAPATANRTIRLRR
jgi:hypothetical protein